VLQVILPVAVEHGVGVHTLAVEGQLAELVGFDSVLDTVRAGSSTAHAVLLGRVIDQLLPHLWLFARAMEFWGPLRPSSGWQPCPEGWGGGHRKPLLSLKTASPASVARTPYTGDRNCQSYITGQDHTICILNP
jgi:hypothetical protein